MFDNEVRKSSGGAALLIALLAAPGAHAQLLVAEPVLDAPPPVAPDVAQVSVSRDIFQSRGAVGLSNRSQTGLDGSTATSRGLIGAWSLTPGLEAGVGLFSVTGDERRQQEMRRDWSAKQVTPRSRNVAAVGMKLKF